MIPRETLEQIASANDIVDVIGGYFPLKRAGSAFKALCPFHQEKSPSFTVNPQRQRYHCFGCGEGGSVFDFVAKYENVDFPTAAKRLAERAGIRIVEEERSPGEDLAVRLRKRLLALHLQAADWYHQLLLNDPRAKGAQSYLKKRGLTREVAERWKIGYAPESWDAFSTWAAGQEYKRDEIVQSGLVSLRDAENPDSDFYDRFRDRVMFPICNDLGEVIAFSGRVLASDAQAAKYVNSPETPLFKKGDILFGLHKSKRAIIDQKSAIVLEGQIDLITAFEADVQNVVAPQGTAFTEKQARMLKRHAAEKVILCFDADEAGRKAAERSLPALLGHDLSVHVIGLPPGEDPDSLIRKEGPEAFKARVDAARDYFDYRLDVEAASPEFATPRGKVKLARAMAETVKLITNKPLREKVASQVAMRLEMALSDFRNLNSGRNRSAILIANEKPAEAERLAARQRLAITEPFTALTLLALGDPDVRKWISEQPWSARLPDFEEASLLLKLLDSDASITEPSSISAFSAELDPDSRNLLDFLLLQRLPEDRLRTARDNWRAIEKRDLARRYELLKAQISKPGLTQAEEFEKHNEMRSLKDQMNRPDPL